MRRKVRWGHLYELDRRIHVGTEAWKRLPRRLRHLSAWRRMHMQPKGHASVRAYGTRHRVRPSSNLRLTGRVSKLAYLKRKGLVV
ncbi:MAG: hypothetical protein JRI66_09150 [Deltaproteobacteria bacterium]|nr:hypothetical protein [Deltaproteobacteria bacterium]